MNNELENDNNFKEQLKNEIHNLTVENIASAKLLYASLIPNDSKNSSMNILNSEQAVNCLRVIRENVDTLVKLFSEVNRSKQEEGNIKSNEIYNLLNDIVSNPFDKRDIN